MQVTVTATQSQLPALHHRRKLILANTGSNVIYYGWEETTSASGDNQGIPLAASAQVSLNGGDIGLSNTLYLICASGQTSTLNYTQA